MTTRLRVMQRVAAPNVPKNVMGAECCESHWRRSLMSVSMACIWKRVPMMPDTWNNWWLWPEVE